MAISSKACVRQFSLRTMLIGISLVAAVLGVIGYQRDRLRRIDSALSEMGGTIIFEEELIAARTLPAGDYPLQTIMRRLIGQKWNATPYALIVTNSGVRDEDLRALPDIDQLRHIDLSFMPLSDGALLFVSEVPTLETLILHKTQMSDNGLGLLKNLEHLEYLDITDTAVTDQGLRHLETMSSLKHVRISRRIVSNEATLRLARRLPKCVIEYD